MKPHPYLPLRMIQDIDDVLRSYSGKTVPVYAEAEKLRRRWLAENRALEDIVDQMLEHAGRHGIGFEIDPSQAADALMGPRLTE